MVSVTKCFLVYKEQPNMDYKTFCKRMFEIQNQVRSYKNLASSEYFSYMMKKNDGADKPDLYTLAIETIPYLNTGNVSCSCQGIQKRFNSDWKAIMKGEKSVASYKTNQPIPLHNKSVKFYEDESKIYVRLSIFSRNAVNDFELNNGMCDFEIWHKCDSSVAIVKRCLSGEYKHCECALKYDARKKMWEFSLSYKFDREQTELDSNRVLGIDLGIKVPIAAAISDSNKKFLIGSDEVDKFRVRTEKMRREIMRSRPVCGDGSVGHGRDARCLPADRIGTRIANFRDTKNHAWSRWIVDIAVKNKCGVIQMEDLTGISSGHKPCYLKNWSYYDLQQKIEYKAKAKGVAVKYIVPKYTSQRCSCCGYIYDGNRTDRDRFICNSCGYEEHADYNAAKNIAIIGIDELIKKSAKAKRT